MLDVKITCVTCWTDSTIVLDWLSDVPIRWQTFIGNRTSQILDVVKRGNWRHVPTNDNPADCASRGIWPVELIKHTLWWNSPSWLMGNEELWPSQKTNYGTSEEERSKYNIALITECRINLFATELINTFSSFRKIIKITAFVQRFAHNLQKGTQRRAGPLTVSELQEATKMICRQNQAEYLREDIMALENSKPLTSHLKYLNPFIDVEGIMRVGGRIEKSDAEYEAKHPIIVPPSRLARLIAQEYHHRYYHAGVQLMLTMLRQKFWLIKGKQQIRETVRSCRSCFKAKPIAMSQEMGNLPKCRVQHIRAFLTVGTDFAGPIPVFHRRGRGQKPFKSYICLFVCTTTRAVHIELTTDLTTSTFLAALKRFIARRGICTDIYSDCGSNYIGADKHLREVYKFLKTNTNEIYNSLLDNSITWHFNPPVAPHFGGLWEAAVKSMKHHLKRVVGETILTVEELQTLLTEIEAILNSRPICYLPSEEDIDILTPAHFIVGHSLVLLPETNIINEKVSRLTRWEMLQQMRQHIWQRWHIEYLTSMQTRSKWTSPKSNVEIDDVVLLIDKNLPPTRWLLGRIIQVFPGSDGLVRVASVKTKNGVFRRAIHALCKLPVESDDSKSGKMLKTV